MTIMYCFEYGTVIISIVSVYVNAQILPLTQNTEKATLNSIHTPLPTSPGPHLDMQQCTCTPH